ncbi:MucBP domain-containing protein [Streptococcus sp. S784/96/1]|uniref:MucBP domain-containing protein n=1 Tax=Streptococcus sp. S784/96/1 TaxID=2653499 RepID=UPI0013874413|nr:MucBP domain-containing protein [Streptococcus sp. S784/96/1]
MFGKHFHTNKKERFGLRKFKQGLASVTVGALLFTTAVQVGGFPSSDSQVVYAAEATYLTSTNWTLNNQISSGNKYIDPNFMTAYTGAETIIRNEEGKEIKLTATITPFGDIPEGISYLVEGDNQSSYGATSDMFVGNPNPAATPALGIYVQPLPYNDPSQWDFNGVREEAVITFRFSEPVVDPIIDVSGIGGSADAYLDNERNGRGSYNSTILSLLTDGVRLEAASKGANLKVTDTVIEAAEKNTYNLSVVPANASGTGPGRYPDMVPAGTGSVRILGTVSEVSFKLSHSATPYSTLLGVGSDFTSNARTNGLNKAWSDYAVVNGRLSQVSNADLFRLSVRLEEVKKGSVIVNYTDTTGTIKLKPTYKDTENGDAGSKYDTAQSEDEKPTEIKVGEKIYRLVPAGEYPVGTVSEVNNLTDTTKQLGTDTVSGKIEADKEKSITYVYQEVKGSVTVEHKTVDGKVLKVTSDVQKDASIGTSYSTTSEEFPGYRLVRVDPVGAPAEGKVTENPQHVVYLYEPIPDTPKTGNVEVHYHIVDKDGKVLTKDAVTKEDLVVDGEAGSTYDATDEKKDEIIVDGKTYVLVTTETSAKPYTDGDAENGDKALVEADKTKVVNYYYIEQPEVKTGSVLVNYVDTDGNQLQPQFVDTKDAPVGTKYDATENNEKPAEIKVGDKTYVLAPEGFYNVGEVTLDNNLRSSKIDALKLAIDAVSGEVLPGERVITYVYKLKEEPQPVAEQGNVEVHYHIVDKDGQVLTNDAITKEDLVVDGEAGSTYDATAKKKEEITVDGKTYVLVTAETSAHAYTDGDKETGEIEANTTKKVNYYYVAKVDQPTPETKKGSVLVRHITEDGTVLAGPVDVVRDGAVGSDYQTSVGNFDGYTFVKVDETGADANGKVEEGEKTVTYIYKKVAETPTPETKKGSVLVRHITEDGTVLSGPADVVRDGVVGSDYQTSVGNFDGYTFVKVDETGADANGKVEEGEKTVTYIYKKVETVVEKNGTVTVEHKTLDGKVLRKTTDVIRNGRVGEAYVTTPETFKGYELVKVDETGAPAKGTVTEGTQHVVYLYKPIVEQPVLKTGSVVARYVIKGTDTEIANHRTVKPQDTPVDTPYTDEAPKLIEKDGKIYRLVAVRKNEGDAPSNGKVIEGKQVITYEYEEVKETEPSSVKPNQTTTVMTPTGQNLPSTGDSGSSLSLVGVTMLAVFGIAGFLRRKED